MFDVRNIFSRLTKTNSVNGNCNHDHRGDDSMEDKSKSWTGYRVSSNGTLRVDPSVVVKESANYFANRSWNPVTKQNIAVPATPNPSTNHSE